MASVGDGWGDGRGLVVASGGSRRGARLVVRLRDEGWWWHRRLWDLLTAGRLQAQIARAPTASRGRLSRWAAARARPVEVGDRRRRRRRLLRRFASYASRAARAATASCARADRRRLRRRFTSRLLRRHRRRRRRRLVGGGELFARPRTAQTCASRSSSSSACVWRSSRMGTYRRRVRRVVVCRVRTIAPPAEIARRNLRGARRVFALALRALRLLAPPLEVLGGAHRAQLTAATRARSASSAAPCSFAARLSAATSSDSRASPRGGRRLRRGRRRGARRRRRARAAAIAVCRRRLLALLRELVQLVLLAREPRVLERRRVHLLDGGAACAPTARRAPPRFP